MSLLVAPQEDLAFASALRAWSLTAILLAAYAVSFVDRQILSLLVQDLRSDLGLSDSQIGLLQGPAFGVFYAIMGLPFGWLADRVDRVRLIAAGLLLWTLMTSLGGLSNSFGMLFLTRMGVGVGEAALVPAAVSLLADSFAPQRRALPLAVFTAGISVGAGMALILGAGLIAFAHDGIALVPLIGPWFGDRAAWQTVLILAGLGGAPLALAILALREPPRRQIMSGLEGGREQFLPYLRRHRRLFVPMLAGSSLLYLFANALSAWMPSLFVRGFGWAPTTVGVRLGTLLLLGSLAGTIASGMIAQRLVRRGSAGGTLITMTGGAALLAPLAMFGPLASGPNLAQIAVMFIYLALSLCFGVATASFVAVTPPALRGRMVALYLMLGNLVGLGLGPLSVGYILDRVLGDARQVGLALAIVAALTVVAGAALLRIALRPHAIRAAEIVE